MAAQTRTGSQRYQKFATTTKRPTGCTRYSQRYFRSAVALSICYFSQFPFHLFSLSGACFMDDIFSPSSNLFCNHSLSTRGESIFLSLSLFLSTNHFSSFRSNDHDRFPRNISLFEIHLKIPLYVLFFFNILFSQTFLSIFFFSIQLRGMFYFSTSGVILLHNA